MPPVKLYGLTKEDYQHPQEKKSIQALEESRGFDTLVKKFYDMGVERIIQLQYSGSSVLLSPSTFPEIHKLLETACDILSVNTLPLLYVQRSDQLMATTLGMDHPMIAISSECIDKLSNEELLFMLGREVAHVKSQHLLYQEIGFIFPELMDALSAVTLGLSSVLSTGLKYALFHWAQTAEYTADRGGLLVCQDVHIVKNLLAKIAGLPEKYWPRYRVEDIEDQAKAFEGFHEKTFDKFVRFLHGNNLWAIARAQEIIDWVESGEYNKLMVRRSRTARIS